VHTGFDAIPQLVIDQGVVFGVLLDEASDERTERNDLPSFCLHIVKRELGEGVSNTVTFKLGIDLGVDKEMSPTPHVIHAEPGDVTVDLDDVPIIVGIVMDENFRCVGLTHALPEKIQRPGAEHAPPKST